MSIIKIQLSTTRSLFGHESIQKWTSTLLKRLIIILSYLNFEIILCCMLCYIESTDSVIPITIALRNSALTGWSITSLFQIDLATDVK